MKTKKILAREFLIFLSITVLLGLGYLFISLWNSQVDKKRIFNQKQFEYYSDSLNHAVENLQNLASEYEKIPMFYTKPEYLVVLYANKIPITNVSRDDLNEYSFNYWYKAICVNNSYKHGVFESYIYPNYSTEIPFSTWEKSVFDNSIIDNLKSTKEITDIDNILSRKQEALTKLKTDDVTLNIDSYDLTVIVAIIIIFYLLRLLYYLTKWSLKTLKE